MSSLEIAEDSLASPPLSSLFAGKRRELAMMGSASELAVVVDEASGVAMGRFDEPICLVSDGGGGISNELIVGSLVSAIDNVLLATEPGAEALDAVLVDVEVMEGLFGTVNDIAAENNDVEPPVD